MDEFDADRRPSSTPVFTLELEESEEELEPLVESAPQSPSTSSPFQASQPGRKQSSDRATDRTVGDRAPGKNVSTNTSSKNTPSSLATDRTASIAPEPNIIFYDSPSTGSSARLLIFCLVSGLIGALCFAGVSIFYFSIGRRVGLFFVIAFAALGARLGAQDLRASSVRWTAALTAGASAVMGKALMVLMLFSLYPDFSAENLSNFIDPGKSAAIYFEQSIVNALSVDGVSGQERLDARFAEEYEEEEEEAGDDKLSFWHVFNEVTEGLDIFLILGAMFFSFKFAGNER